jgi:allantoate deiminase
LSGAVPEVPIEVIGFSEEEGVRYGTPFIGSRAVVGTIDEELRERITPALRAFGLDPECLPEAVVRDAAGYFEIHIEQGPVLEHLDLQLGVVESIVGLARLSFEFRGHANHAGTTPMELRRDALAAAAEWCLAVEREATGGLAATVGKFEVEPGAVNVIPGLVRASLDIRHRDDAVREAAVKKLIAAAREIAGRRGLTVTCETVMEQAAVAMETARLREAVAAAGFPVHTMVSGAGHDAMVMARLCPAAMLFVRSPGGISHHPDESVRREDVAAAIAVGSEFLRRWVA